MSLQKSNDSVNAVVNFGGEN